MKWDTQLLKANMQAFDLKNDFPVSTLSLPLASGWTSYDYNNLFTYIQWIWLSENVQFWTKFLTSSSHHVMCNLLRCALLKLKAVGYIIHQDTQMLPYVIIWEKHNTISHCLQIPTENNHALYINSFHKQNLK